MCKQIHSLGLLAFPKLLLGPYSGLGFGADVDDQAVVFDVVAVGFGYFFLGGFDLRADKFNDSAGFHADHVVVVFT